jgi:CBS domain containing-hemolysin-like protein
LFSIATSVIAVIVFGELLPRRFASNLPERTAVLFSSVTSFFMMILKPFTLFFGAIDVLISKVFKSSDDRKMTQDELLDLVEEVTEEGGIDSTESELLRSAIEFTDREASDILTPRIAVEAVSDELSNEEIGKRFMESGYSRLPVYNESIDNIVGIIHQKDFFSSVMGTDNSIKAIMNKPVYIPLSMKISDILKLLQKNKSHIAIVVDEYGGTMGIVTMEDILEELVGEIWDEHDEVVEDFVKVSDNCYKILCTTDLDKMFKFFDMEDETDAATVGGWVLEKLGYFPKENESFEFKNIDISIIDADDQRVNEIIVTVKEAEASEE